MGAGKLAPFGGMLPARDDRLLPDFAAALSTNTWLYSGSLRGLPEPELVRACTAGTGKVYRIPNNLTDSSHISDSVWMEFASINTDVLRTPVVGDTHERYYWASPAHAPRYNTLARITAASSHWLLGVPAPSAAPTVSPAGGVSTTMTTRSYVVTFVSAYGEEGPPSDPVTATGKIDDTWTVTLASASFTDLGNSGADRYLTKARIYRTVTSSLGVATYFRVTEVNIPYKVVRTGDTHSNTTVDDLSTTTDLIAGLSVSGSGIPGGTTIATIAGATSITLSAAATTTVNNVSLTFSSGDLTYADSNSDTTVSSNAELESTTWTGPPTDLQGWVSMGNGMFVGWRENELWFSEPYRPHAWPAAYVLTVEYPIVGLGVSNQTLVVGTQGFPMTGAGVRPATFVLSKVSSLEPCTSRGSIVGAPEGVYYTSPNGLIIVSQGQAVNVTRKLVNKDQWQQQASLSTVRATWLGSAYYAYGTSLPGVFQTDTFQTNAFAQEDFSGAYAGVLIDPTDERIAYNRLSTSTPTTNVWQDNWSSDIMLIRSDNLYRINLADSDPTLESYIWRSKIFQVNEKGNLAAYKIFFNVPANTPTQAASRNTSAVQTLASDQYGLVRLYGDGTLVSTREIRTSGELMLVPSGFFADYWQWEIEARVNVTSIQFASTVRELAQI